MMRLVVFAIVLSAGQAARPQQTKPAECLADASKTAEVSLLQSLSAFERQSAGGAEEEALVEETAGDLAQGAADAAAASEERPARAEGLAFEEEEDRRQPAKGEKKAKAEAEEEEEADATPADGKADTEAKADPEADAAPAKQEKQEAAADGDGVAKIEPFGREDTAAELQSHAAKTQDTLIDAVENAEVAEIKRSVFRALTRLRAAEIKEFDTIARLETQAIDEYNDDHHYRAENPLQYLHAGESEVQADKYSSFHD